MNTNLRTGPQARDAAPAGRVQMFGICLDPLTRVQAVARVGDWLREPQAQCRIIVTPNVDHVVKLQTDPHFRAAYADAALVLADGKPVVFASRLLRRPLPETVPGSDFVPAIFEAAPFGASLRVFLLGAAPGVAERAARAIERRWPAARVCGLWSPPMGFQAGTEASETALRMLDAAAPDLLVVGLGAPRQELWTHAVRTRLNARVAICAGATIDFLAGERDRAPVWVRRIGFEWLHRALSEPRRLMGRYLHDLRIFPVVVIKEWWKS